MMDRMPVPIAKGKFLDNVGKILGVDRIQYWWIFKESDKKYRTRLRNIIRK